MAYTKQQLIQAFCEARNCNVSDLPDVETQIQTRLDNQREQIQNRLNALPLTAKEQMKQIAIEHLNKEANKQAVIDNSGVKF